MTWVLHWFEIGDPRCGGSLSSVFRARRSSETDGETGVLFAASSCFPRICEKINHNSYSSSISDIGEMNWYSLSLILLEDLRRLCLPRLLLKHTASFTSLPALPLQLHIPLISTTPQASGVAGQSPRNQDRIPQPKRVFDKSFRS